MNPTISQGNLIQFSRRLYQTLLVTALYRGSAPFLWMCQWHWERSLATWIEGFQFRFARALLLGNVAPSLLIQLIAKSQYVMNKHLQNVIDFENNLQNAYFASCINLLGILLWNYIVTLCKCLKYVCTDGMCPQQKCKMLIYTVLTTHFLILL